MHCKSMNSRRYQCDKVYTGLTIKIIVKKNHHATKHLTHAHKTVNYMYKTKFQVKIYI